MVSLVSLRPGLRLRSGYLSFKTEDCDRDEREGLWRAKDFTQVGSEVLDWFEMITKLGLGLQSTQWPVYIHGELCYQ
jgi:hypothetical protein